MTSNHHSGFLQEIVAHPDDPVPRLIYADWLEEIGDPRGEFIRVQCELAGPCKRTRRQVLVAREQALLAEHRDKWLAPLGRLKNPEFHRGFVERARTTVRTFVNSGAELLSLTPLRYLTFQAAPSQVAALVKCPHLTWIAGLEVLQSRLGDEGLELLAGCAHLQNLRELRLRPNSISERGAAALAQSPNFANLRTLWISTNLIGDRGVQHVAGSQRLAGLETLRVETCGAGNAGAQALAKSPHLKKLKILDLEMNYALDAAGVRSLATSTNLSGVQFLSLGGCRIGSAGAVAISQSPHLPRLKTLDLNHCRVQDAGVRAIAQSPLLAQLIDLRLSDNDISAAGVEALLSSPHWTGKTRLYLAKNRLSESDVVRLRTRYGKSLGL